MSSEEDFPDYIEEEGDWEFYRPILCQFISSEKVPDDAYRAEQVQDVFPHGDTYMPDTGLKAKEDRFPDPVWSSRDQFETYVRDIADYNILEIEQLEFEETEIDDEIVGIERAKDLEGRDIYMLISEIDERMKALE